MYQEFKTSGLQCNPFHDKTPSRKYLQHLKLENMDRGPKGSPISDQVQRTLIQIIELMMRFKWVQ